MDKNDIIEYVMNTPHNTNWNVLSTVLGEGDWSKLKTYVEATPKNMNRKVLESLLDGGSESTNNKLVFNLTHSISGDYEHSNVQTVLEQMELDENTKSFFEPNTRYNVTAQFVSGLITTGQIFVSAMPNSDELVMFINSLFESGNIETSSTAVLSIHSVNNTIVASGNVVYVASSQSQPDVLQSVIETFGNKVTFTFTKVS